MYTYELPAAPFDGLFRGFPAVSVIPPSEPFTVSWNFWVFLKEEAEARDAAIAATKKTMRINSLEIETVTLKDGVIVPDRIRERIRAEGPSAPRFDRQHLDKDGHVSI